MRMIGGRCDAGTRGATSGRSNWSLGPADGLDGRNKRWEVWRVSRQRRCGGHVGDMPLKMAPARVATYSLREKGCRPSTRLRGDPLKLPLFCHEKREK